MAPLEDVILICCTNMKAGTSVTRTCASTDLKDVFLIDVDEWYHNGAAGAQSDAEARATDRDRVLADDQGFAD